MAQITHARTFNGSTDFLEMAIGGLDSSLTSMSVVSIVSPVDAGTFRDILVIETPTGFAFGLGSTSNELYYFNGAALANSSGNFADEANGWMVIAVTKPSGTSTVRWHKYVYDTDTWTHEADGTSLAQPTTPTSASEVYIGGQSSFNGMIACLGYWATDELSDGELEGMPDTLASWSALSPDALWLLNQASVATTVEDLAGTSDEIGRTGTTATAVNDLPFDVGGNVVAWITA
jgi:hypothetical protein